MKLTVSVFPLSRSTLAEIVTEVPVCGVTPVRKTRRKYEEKNKEKRKQASGNFGTMIPRVLYDEINAFLEENGITKVRLIKEGYEALKNMKKAGKL